MTQQPLQLRKVRDLGEKIGDSFLFLKQNFKNLFAVYAVFVVPFIIIAVIIAIFFAGRVYSAMLSSAFDYMAGDFFSYEFFIIILCFIMAMASYNTAVYAYFSLYDQQKGVQPTIQQVGQVYFSNVFKIIGYNIAVGFVLLLIAIIPYLIVMFIPLLGFFGQMAISVLFGAIISTLNNIYIREGLGIGNASSRLFHLFRDKWWHTIFYSFIMSIIYGVFSGVLIFIGAMIFMLVFINTGIERGYGQAGFTASKLSWTVIGVGIFFLVQQVFQLITLTGSAVNYYSLCEEKDGTAIEEMIDSIGDTTDKYGGVEEQY